MISFILAKRHAVNAEKQKYARILIQILKMMSLLMNKSLEETKMEEKKLIQDAIKPCEGSVSRNKKKIYLTRKNKKSIICFNKRLGQT